jgi:NAD(P)-dependent dehydrogenase (short-subunit alcohol dehydrogenase family)
MTPDDFDVVVRVHLRGTFLLSHYVAQYWRELAKAGTPIRGRIVNTTSGAGLQGNFGQSNYAAAKAGIAALTMTNSLELASIGATVNCVGPSGATRISGTVARLNRELREPDEIEGYADSDPSNSSPLVAWLCSDEAQYVTGQVIRAVRDTIYWMKPWYEKQKVSNDQQRWDAEKLGDIVGRDLFEVNAKGINF